MWLCVADIAVAAVADSKDWWGVDYTVQECERVPTGGLCNKTSNTQEPERMMKPACRDQVEAVHEAGAGQVLVSGRRTGRRWGRERRRPRITTALLISPSSSVGTTRIQRTPPRWPAGCCGCDWCDGAGPGLIRLVDSLLSASFLGVRSPGLFLGGPCAALCCLCFFCCSPLCEAIDRGECCRGNVVDVVVMRCESGDAIGLSTLISC